MIQTLKTKLSKGKKGFTLAELLIVVAIIAILIAIAVPIFTVQLNKAKDSTIQSNMRSAMSMASTKHLLDDPAAEVTYHYTPDAIGNLEELTADGEYQVTIDDAGEITAILHPAFFSGDKNTTALEPGTT